MDSENPAVFGISDSQSGLLAESKNHTSILDFMASYQSPGRKVSLKIISKKTKYSYLEAVAGPVKTADRAP